MIELSVNFFLKAIYLLIFTNYLVKFVKWMHKYVTKINSVNRLKGLPMVPFIGNIHQLKTKHGKIFFLFLKTVF